ncbi:family 43 glycosylhydrolase [Leifsonia aquatica]|uniref:family 43 glycosylhydrolase n=1 Tax=Leifsonia aquatica TaxID=144185 RepID=UPI00069347E1|nr:family 43 glycosylhydrolase [Leifsonia aquatica]
MGAPSPDQGHPTISVRNPILRGMNPDPSICRVGEDYFVATSTFEWFPGVRLHHSTDLASWTVAGHALDESNGFDLTGYPDSGGVWAPSLTWADDKFWLVYSVVRTMDGDDLDLDNYLVHSTSIEGPWSPPIRLGSRGFDFSMFHDNDRHWLVGVQWDHRPDADSFSGIVLEEYFPGTETVGSATPIYQQDELAEGPNLYYLNGWYYLLLAEGGTGWNHGITVARSRCITGPYQRDHAPAVLTARDTLASRMSKAGHGELVQTVAGEWALVHLASRPVLHAGERFSMLGRETALQRVQFDAEGWIRLGEGGHHPLDTVTFRSERAVGAGGPTARAVHRDDFDTERLDTRRWSTLRRELGTALDLNTRPGWLRLHGGQSGSSVFDQSMIVERIEESSAQVETLVDADPFSSRQAAGLAVWYNRSAWIWLALTWDETSGRHLRVMQRDRSTTWSRPFRARTVLPVRMRAQLTGGDLQFAVASEFGDEWDTLPGVFPAWKLSDDFGGDLRFTGLLAGVRSEDLDATGWYADFDYVETRFWPDDEG